MRGGQDSTISTITLAWEMPVRRDLEPWVSAGMLHIHTAGNLRWASVMLLCVIRCRGQPEVGITHVIVCDTMQGAT